MHYLHNDSVNNSLQWKRHISNHLHSHSQASALFLFTQYVVVEQIRLPHKFHTFPTISLHPKRGNIRTPCGCNLCKGHDFEVFLVRLDCCQGQPDCQNCGTHCNSALLVGYAYACCVHHTVVSNVKRRITRHLPRLPSDWYHWKKVEITILELLDICNGAAILNFNLYILNK